jgi:hypothetical protein
MMDTKSAKVDAGEHGALRVVRLPELPPGGRRE